MTKGQFRLFAAVAALVVLGAFALPHFVQAAELPQTTLADSGALAKMLRQASPAEEAQFRSLLARTPERVMAADTTPVPTQPPQPSIPLFPATDSSFPAFVQVETRMFNGYLVGYDAGLWIVKTIPAGTPLAKRTIYSDGSFHLSAVQTLNFDLTAGNGWALGGMSQPDAFTGLPVAVQVLVPDFKAGVMQVVSGEIRSRVNPGNWQATSAQWDITNGYSVLVLNGIFQPQTGIAVVVNGQKVGPAAIQLGYNQMVIRPDLDPYLNMLQSWGPIIALDVTVEQNGSCTTNSLPFVDTRAQKGSTGSSDR